MYVALLTISQGFLIRNPQLDNYRFLKDSLELLATSVTLNDETHSPSFLGLRQRGMYGSVKVKLDVYDQEAGITLYMNEKHHYDFAILQGKDEKTLIKRRCVGDMKYIQQHMKIIDEDIRLLITFTNENYSFVAQSASGDYDFGTANVKYLSAEVADGFTGVMIGLYAQGENTTSDYTAKFSEFSCEYIDKIDDEKF